MLLHIYVSPIYIMRWTILVEVMTSLEYVALVRMSHISILFGFATTSCLV